ncbi:uncharacterized protein VTP21DRAFT_5791 [Calcarisporiella thermophila]|uniref:uncharacterized protein n=1 Tax=Calcarisporiella thermophila TaxID=911321 RepID=UPI00374382B1
MKFGVRLKDSIYPEWQEQYLDYNALKNQLKQACNKEGGYTEKDESEFVERLDKELEKINSFHANTLHELEQRASDCDAHASNIDQYRESAPMRLQNLLDEINTIVDSVNRLSQFARLNYTGFLKIVKKHDKRVRYILRPMLVVRLNQCPFWKVDYDPLLIQLSRLYHFVRSGGEPSLGEFIDASTETTQTFIRKSTKFWVHPDNVVEVKTFILKHLPVLVYNAPSGSQDTHVDPSISSVYLDNAGFELYTRKVERDQGSETLRLRWYGSAEERREVFVERKRHAEEEDEMETKDRFPIKVKYLPAFLEGKYDVEHQVAKLRRKATKSPEMIESFARLASEIQATICQKKLQPVLRTFYHRTAFQIPGDKRVRISLDSEVTLMREDTHLFPDDPTVRRPNGAWRRPDADVDFPFRELKDGAEINRFPFAVLEVKLATTEVPHWVNELVASNLVEEAPRFSKFAHGVATLFESRVQLLPFWLAQMEEVFQREQMERLARTQHQKAVAEEAQRKHRESYDHKRRPSQIEVVIDSSYVPSSRSKDKGKGKSVTIAEPEITEEPEDMMEVRQGEGAEELEPPGEPSETSTLLRRSAGYGSTNHDSLGDTQSNGKHGGSLGGLTKVFRRRHPHTGTPASVTLPPGVKVPKKVFTPIRVEPKVYFANERTFLSWMRFSLLLGSLSLGLFNSGDVIGRYAGLIYAIISLTSMIYSLGLYERRRDMIRKRDPGPYDDLVGPTVLCVALFASVLLNSYLKVSFKVRKP